MEGIDKIITKVKGVEGIKSILDHNGEVFLVGGIVRDSFLNRESKDIDLIVRNIPFNELTHILKGFGQLDVVGQSFGVIKFTPSGWDLDEPIDIAIPRTETKVGDSHQDFDVVFDHTLPIEADLARRDLTINAMAVNIETNELIDPFGGMEDINNNTIDCIWIDGKTHFNEDPLRMFRALQFSSRFDFIISEELVDLIKANKEDVKNVSGERIFIELEKMFNKKANDLAFARAIWHFNLTGMNEVLNRKTEFAKWARPVNTFFDFIVTMVHGDVHILRDVLKAPVKLVSALESLNSVSDQWLFVTALRHQNRNEVLKTSGLWKSALTDADLLEGVEAAGVRSLAELAVNGSDLIEKGLKGQEIGNTLEALWEMAASNSITNTKIELLKMVQ